MWRTSNKQASCGEIKAEQDLQRTQNREFEYPAHYQKPIKNYINPDFEQTIKRAEKKHSTQQGINAMAQKVFQILNFKNLKNLTLNKIR